jgi:hypothetical protein
MKLERRKFKFQSYYNSIQGYPMPCECVLEYVEPFEAEALEKRVEELEAALCETCKDPRCEDSQIGYWILKAQGYEKALREIAKNPRARFLVEYITKKALEERSNHEEEGK